MAYLELFDRVISHVKKEGLKVTFKRGKPLSRAVIEKSRQRSVIPIPLSLAEFYQEVGDGMLLHWAAKGERAAFSRIQISKIGDCVISSLESIKWRTEWDDNYEFKFTKDPKLAKKTAIKMRRWLPLHGEGNGDYFCLDTASDPTPLVYDCHDWFDGGTGKNGHVLGATLLKFFEEWAQVCFQQPHTLWWPNVFKKSDHGINWRSKEFCDPFRLKP